MVQQSRLRSKCHSGEQAHARLRWKESSDIPTLTGVIDEVAAVDSSTQFGFCFLASVVAGTSAKHIGLKKWLSESKVLHKQ